MQQEGLPPNASPPLSSRRSSRNGAASAPVPDQTPRNSEDSRRSFSKEGSASHQRVSLGDGGKGHLKGMGVHHPAIAPSSSHVIPVARGCFP